MAVRHESARTLTDVLMRRTGIGTLGLPADAVLEAVADVTARELGWTDERRDAELAQAHQAQAHQALALPW